MKRSLRCSAFILALILMAQTATTGAVVFDDLDAKTAVAGASYALENFLYTYEDAEDQLNAYLNKEETAEETVDPEALILYEAEKTGKVAVGSVLNVRKEPDTESDIIGGAVIGQELTIVGERTIDGVLWYYLMLTDYHGYVAGDFIEVIDEGEVPADEPETEDPENASEGGTETPGEEGSLQQAPEQTVSGPEPLPTQFSLGSDADQAGVDVYEQLAYWRDEINYLLREELPNKQGEGQELAAYSVVCYILEFYQKIAESAVAHSMHDTFLRATRDISRLEEERELLSAKTGVSEKEFYEMEAQKNAEVQAAQAEAERQRREAEEAAAAAAAAQQAANDEAARRAAEEAAAQAAEAQRQAEAAAREAEEARRAAEEAARQERENQVAEAGSENSGTLGREIADLAATYVGWLPYVWGGASLTSGADCSGFVAQIMAAKGLLDQGKANSHGYDSGSLRGVGYGVDLANIQPGDIVCYNGHVAIYYGNGMIVHEPAPGRFAEFGNVHMLSIITIRRLY